MKKTLKLSALVLATAILCSSCIGSFQLTNKLKDYNDGIGSKWVNELVFVAFCIVPVYEISLLVDAVVLNSIEFWTGDKALAQVGEKKVVKNAKGQAVEITTLENGYCLSDGNSSMNFIYDEAEQIWIAQYEDQVTNLIKLVNENKAQLFLQNGEIMDITLDKEGIEMARNYMGNFFAMK